jgi:uncharacterized protein YecE (DUF72 family)
MGEIRVGTAGWTDRSLIASGWYPADANTPEKRLRYYARQFPLVEVDATYYALPAEQTARAWAERTPAGFTFNIKAFSLFTQHPTPVRALPTDLRAAAGQAGKDRVYLKDVLAATSDLAVVRMHGHSDKWTSKEIAERFGYRYREGELDEWAPKIRVLAAEAEVTHVVFNNCYRDYAHVNAQQLEARLGR